MRARLLSLLLTALPLWAEDAWDQWADSCPPLPASLEIVGETNARSQSLWTPQMQEEVAKESLLRRKAAVVNKMSPAERGADGAARNE
eukprot:s1264_g4.t1